MIREFLQELPICQKHNLQQEYVHPDKTNANQTFACRLCIDAYYSLIPIEQVKQSNIQIIQQFESQSKQNINYLNEINQSLISFRFALAKQVQNIKLIINQIENQISETELLVKQVQQSIMKKTEILYAHEKYLQLAKEFQKITVQQIELLRNNQAIEKIISSFSQMNFNKLDQSPKKVQIFKTKTAIQSNRVEPNEKFDYQLLPYSSIQYKEWCGALDFSLDASMVIVGCDEKIKVFEFKNDQLKEVSILKGHETKICCLQFIKQSNDFISGDQDGKILVWHTKNNSLWESFQSLVGHKGFIYCLILNVNQNLIISSSSDSSIIFWAQKDQKWNIDQRVQCSSKVYSISLNQSNTKLISSEDNKLIQVFEQQKKIWKVVQKIFVEEFGFRLCFVSDNQFVFLPFGERSLHFYNQDSSCNEFIKVNELYIKCNNLDLEGFPIQLNKQKNLLIVKNHSLLNIIRKKEDNKFVLDQSIKFESCGIYGKICDDGQYLIVYERKNQIIQVRKLLSLV